VRFPGMDPYLEDPRLWPDVHARLIVYLAEHLQPQLRPRYRAAVETRVFVEGPDREIIPDVWLRRHQPQPGPAAAVLDADTPVEVQVTELEIHETFVQILDCQTGQRVVTVVEVLSPTNKLAGPGRSSFLAKQHEILRSQAHLVEIDLLRQGPHVLAVPEAVAAQLRPYDYLVSVNRAAGTRSRFQLYARRLRERLPRVRIPLADTDPDVVLDLQTVLERTYEAGAYEDQINYGAACMPLLPPEEQTWANECIRTSQPPSS
jgi:hypothetical protein